jgi:hypothetical protein
MTTPTRVEVCCDPACENHNIAQVIELTPEEIAQMEADSLAAEQERVAREAGEAALQAAKESAQAKLANLGLTPEEIAALSK